MRKFKIVVKILALAVVIFNIIACNKEKVETKTYGEMETVSKEDDMNTYLKQFKEKMQSATKSNEALSMEEARWHLEAVLNYTYGDAGRQVSDIQCDTFYYTLHTDGEEVTLAQLNEAFNALSFEVEKAYSNCDLPDKSILAIQTSFESERKDGDIVIRSVLSTRGLDLLTWPPRFDSTDYWNEYYDWGFENGGGKCGAFSGECSDSGAPKELTNKANLLIPFEYCEDGYRTYFTDHCWYEIDIFFSNSCFYYYLMDENSPSGFKLYYCHTSDGCIPPEEMNYYLDKSQEIIEYLQPNGKIPICCKYFWDEITGYRGENRSNSFRNSFHTLKVQYAEIHCELIVCDQ